MIFPEEIKPLMEKSGFYRNIIDLVLAFCVLSIQ